MTTWNSATKLQTATGSTMNFEGAFLFDSGTVEKDKSATTHVDPKDLIPANQDSIAPAPPASSGYREANVQGISCWNCGHFTATGDDDDDGIVDGICNLWEARADGSSVCDRFTAHSDLLRQSPHTSWAEDLQNDAIDQARRDAMGPSVDSFDYSDTTVLNEIIFASSAVEDDGLVWKDILRTGEWSHTPTLNGVVAKKLQIVRDGKSDPAGGIIALAELLENFDEKAIPYVTIPLSDDAVDHKNIARLNTGFVRKLKIVDEDGRSLLRAGMDFTEPDVKEKVLRGTIPDVSAGIPFGVTRRRDNKTFTAVLDHVCLTRKPFIDSLSPFGIAAADDEATMPVEAWEEEQIGAEGAIDRTDDPPKSEIEPTATEQEIKAPETHEPDNSPAAESTESLALSFNEQINAIQTALKDQLGLTGQDYRVSDINPSNSVVVISHRISNSKWDVPFKITNDQARPVKIAGVDHWKIKEEDRPAVAASDQNADSLKNAQHLRELRLAQPTIEGGIEMSVSSPPISLEGVELSDDARARVQAILDENRSLRARDRESEANARISELEALGLKDRPGALKFYREVMLSDDGGPAVVLFADSQDESKREKLTTISVLDRFIDALKADGGVTFSDQITQSANDNKPPTDASGEAKALDDRVADAKEALYGKRSTRK